MNLRHTLRVLRTTLKYMGWVFLLVMFSGLITAGQYVSIWLGGVAGVCAYWFAIILTACFLAALYHHKHHEE